MFGFNIAEALRLIVGLLVAITVHEASHAYWAYRLGDPTPKALGRVTLNPIAHLDPLGTVMMLVAAISGFGFGWGKPVPVNPFYLRRFGPKTGMAIVSVAGPASNLVVAGLLLLPLRLDLVPTLVVAQFLLSVAWVNVFIALFNLIPIPPLDGFSVLLGVLPTRIGASLAQLQQYGPMLLLLLVFAGMRWLGPTMASGALAIIRLYLG